MDVINVGINVKNHVWIVIMVNVINVKMGIYMNKQLLNVYQHVEIKLYSIMNNVMMVIMVFMMYVIYVNFNVMNIVLVVKMDIV